MVTGGTRWRVEDVPRSREGGGTGRERQGSTTRGGGQKKPPVAGAVWDQLISDMIEISYEARSRGEEWPSEAQSVVPSRYRLELTFQIPEVGTRPQITSTGTLSSESDSPDVPEPVPLGTRIRLGETKMDVLLSEKESSIEDARCFPFEMNCHHSVSEDVYRLGEHRVRWRRDGKSIVDAMDISRTSLRSLISSFRVTSVAIGSDLTSRLAAEGEVCQMDSDSP